MKLKSSLVFVLFAAYLQISHVLGLSCSYRERGATIYFCDLTIQNSNGLNNFTEIGGTHLPGRTNEDVTQIQRTPSTISTNVPSILCKTFPNVIGMDLWVSRIEKIDEDSFKDCRKLMHLHLGGNIISEIHESAFNENPILNFLFLSNNRLFTLSEKLFLNQRQLIILNVGGNYISDLPNGIFDPLQNLVELSLSVNRLTHPKVEWFRNLIDLENLFLTSNNIENLPRNIFNPLQRLSRLDLSDNQLKVINSNWFGTIPNLSTVLFQRNQINAVDERFIDNTGVNWLGMQNNVCMNLNVFDESPSRQQMRNALELCFQNFQDECVTGSIDERVCKLEIENQQQQRQINDLKKAVEELVNRNFTCT